MKSKTRYNTELYDYIVKYYVEAEDPVSRREIAEKFGYTIGAIDNFLYRHDLHKNKRATL